MRRSSRWKSPPASRSSTIWMRSWARSSVIICGTARASEFLHALAVAGGAAQHLLDAVARQDGGDADRRGQLQLGVAEIERMGGHAAGDALGGVERAVRVEMVEQQREGA